MTCPKETGVKQLWDMLCRNIIEEVAKDTVQLSVKNHNQSDNAASTAKIGSNFFELVPSEVISYAFLSP